VPPRRRTGGRRDGPPPLISDAFERLGLAAERLRDVTITPTCGLASSSVAQARHTHRAAVDVARELTEEEHA